MKIRSKQISKSINNNGLQIVIVKNINDIEQIYLFIPETEKFIKVDRVELKKMIKVKYIVSKGELIGFVPEGSIIINCYLMFEDLDNDNALIYFPPKLQYTDVDSNIKYDTCDSCGFLSFAKKENGYYHTGKQNYINLQRKDAQFIEKQIIGKKT